MTQHQLAKAAPLLFVLFWSTGFIGAVWGLPYAEPFTFLALRFAIAAPVLAAIALLMGSIWPDSLRQVGHIAVVGLLIHGGYLGGGFGAMGRGMPAAVCALLLSLQPMFTVLLANLFLGDRVRPGQIVGMVLGLAGVALVLLRDVTSGDAQALLQDFDLPAVLFCALAVGSMSVGLVYQKRFCQETELWTGGAIQYVAAAAFVAVIALLFEDLRVTWTGDFVFALSWLILVLSIGAVSLLMLLVRWGEASRVSSLFYLVPPVTAIIAFFLFGDRLGPQALVGMAIAVVGVALAMRPPKNERA